MNRLYELLEKEFLNLEEYEEVEEHENVIQITSCGMSGKHPQYKLSFVRFCEEDGQEMESEILWK